METRKHDILQALSAFVNQRPGFDWHNYDSMSSYRSDYRPVLQEMHDFHTMRRQIELRNSITADDIIRASEHAFSGRLTIIEKPDRVIDIDYCTGQYWPTEYRAAACAVLSAVLWDYWRSDIDDSIENKGGYLRKMASREFGRGMASRWFR